MIYLTLFYEFFQIGLFSIGGGLATLPYLYKLADKYTWFSKEMLIDMIAVSESTPGPIGINMATYAGFTAAGALGGVVATIALVLPSFIIISVIVRVLNAFNNNLYVKSAFYGLRPAVTALIASAAAGIFTITILRLPADGQFQSILDIVNYKQMFLFVALFIAARKFNKLHPIYFIGAAAIVGAVFKL